MNGIQWSKNWLVKRTGWTIDESTFQVLDEEKGIWIARAITTHLHRNNEPEYTFNVLMRDNQHVILSDDTLDKLTKWRQEIASNGYFF